jgi:hypothetical protein
MICTGGFHEGSPQWLASKKEHPLKYSFRMMICGIASGKPHIPGLVNIQKAIERGHRKFVDLPIKNGDFP